MDEDLKGRSLDMVKEMLQERRSWVRAKRILSIQFRLVQGRRKQADRAWHLSTTEDMSSGGLSFYTETEYQINDIVEIHVTMSGILDLFKGYGKIVRIEKKAMGVCYLVAVKFSERESKTRNFRRPTAKVKSRIKR